MGGGRATGGAGRGGARWRNRCVLGALHVGGCTPPSVPPVGWLVLGEGGERPGTRRPRRGMEEAAAEAAAAADVIWSWAEQVMEKGDHDPGGGKPTDGKWNPTGTPELA